MTYLPKTYTSRTGWYRVRLPENWIAEESKCEVSLFDPANGIGALQISAYRFPKGWEPDLRKVLVEHLEQMGIQVDRVSFSIKKNSSKKSVQAHCKQDNDYWEIWILAGREVLLFVTYNCPATELEELPLVKAMIETLEVE